MIVECKYFYIFKRHMEKQLNAWKILNMVLKLMAEYK